MAERAPPRPRSLSCCAARCRIRSCDLRSAGKSSSYRPRLGHRDARGDPADAGARLEGRRPGPISRSIRRNFILSCRTIRAVRPTRKPTPRPETTPSIAVRIECAKLSLPGNRQDNQDRVDVLTNGSSALLVVVDGMGGHAEGAKAAEVTVATIAECFAAERGLVFDPQGFLTLALTFAHARVAALGGDVAIGHKPRATCALCLVQDASAYWAHIGDSRIYQLRGGRVVQRTRDHSHVELLRKEGLIAEREMRSHPMRNFVECCLGGDSPLPNMSITSRKVVCPGDVLLVCTDGLWTGAEDAEVGALSVDAESIEQTLTALVRRAVARNHPHSDNTSAAALRWLGR